MARPSNFAKLSYTELKQMKVRLETELASRESAERQKLKEEMEAMAAKSGFSVTEIIGATPGRKSARQKNSKVPPKYRNPKDPSQTWSGRGRPPLWLAAALKKGSKKDAFLIRD